MIQPTDLRKVARRAGGLAPHTRQQVLKTAVKGGCSLLVPPKAPPAWLGDIHTIKAALIVLLGDAFEVES